MEGGRDVTYLSREKISEWLEHRKHVLLSQMWLLAYDINDIKAPKQHNCMTTLMGKCWPPRYQSLLGQHGPTWVFSDPDGHHVGPMNPCYQGTIQIYRHRTVTLLANYHINHLVKGDAIIYVSTHHVIFRIYLYFLNIVLNFFKYSCTNIFHRRSLYTIHKYYMVIHYVWKRIKVTNCSFVITYLYK